MLWRGRPSDAHDQSHIPVHGNAHFVMYVDSHIEALGYLPLRANCSRLMQFSPWRGFGGMSCVVNVTVVVPVPGCSNGLYQLWVAVTTKTTSDDQLIPAEFDMGMYYIRLSRTAFMSRTWVDAANKKVHGRVLTIPTAYM